jgi:hypothetical protein
MTVWGAAFSAEPQQALARIRWPVPGEVHCFTNGLPRQVLFFEQRPAVSPATPPWEKANVRPLLCQTLTLLLSFSLLAGVGRAQQTRISPRCHPWGRFQPGAWQLVRVATETLDENGQVAGTSVAERQTSLMKVEEDGVTLQVDVCVEVAGKRLGAEPRTVKLGFHGERAGADLKVAEGETGYVVIERQKIPCQILQLESAGPTSKTVTKVYYSAKVAPYVLKRESATTDLNGQTTLSEVSIDVVRLNMPHQVLSECKNAAFVEGVQKHAKGTVITLAFTSTDVPGGIVWHSCKELDKDGRLIRRSTLELLNYGLKSERGRLGLFGRKRPGLLRKPSPRRTLP